MGTKKTPHTYADVIKAWADGYEVQHKFKDSQSWRDTFIVDGEWPGFNPIIDWRVKPVEQSQEPIAQPNYFEQFKVICKGIADGNGIQYRKKGDTNWITITWYTGGSEYHFDFDKYELRVKPNTKTIHYQNYLWQNEINCWASNDIESRLEIASDGLFVCWIGEEQAITIEVDDDN